MSCPGQYQHDRTARAYNDYTWLRRKEGKKEAQCNIPPLESVSSLLLDFFVHSCTLPISTAFISLIRLNSQQFMDSLHMCLFMFVFVQLVSRLLTWGSIHPKIFCWCVCVPPFKCIFYCIAAFPSLSPHPLLTVLFVSLIFFFIFLSFSLFVLSTVILSVTLPLRTELVLGWKIVLLARLSPPSL